MISNNLNYNILITMMKSGVANLTGNDLNKKCENLGMFKQQFVEQSPNDSPLRFDNTFTLIFKMPGSFKGVLTIFEYKQRITEAEIQVFYLRFSLNRKCKRDFRNVNESFRLNNYYLTNTSNKNKNTFHYQDGSTYGYVSKSKLLIFNVLTLRFGNRPLWDAKYSGIPMN